MLDLQLREIGERLSPHDDLPFVADALIVGSNVWADSSLELQRGLDVVEIGALLPAPAALEGFCTDPAALEAR